MQFDRFCQLVAALQENLKNILKIDENENLSNRADAHWLLHTEAFLLNVWRWPMKQTIEEKSGIFSAFYQESDLNYRLLGGLICDQFRFNSSSKGVNVMVLE